MADNDDYGPVLDRLEQDHRREVDVEIRSMSSRGCCYGRRKACCTTGFVLLALMVAVYVMFGEEINKTSTRSSNLAASEESDAFPVVDDSAADKKNKKDEGKHKKDDYEEFDEDEAEEEEFVKDNEKAKEASANSEGLDAGDAGGILDEETFDEGGKDDTPQDDVQENMQGCMGDKMESEVPLETGQFICAKHGMYKFGVSEEGSLVWVDEANNITKTYRQGKPGYQFVLRDDGRMDVYNKHGDKKWEKECLESVHYKKDCINGHNCPFLHMHGDGLVLLNWVGEASELGEVEEDGEVLEEVGQVMEKRIAKMYEGMN